MTIWTITVFMNVSFLFRRDERNDTKGTHWMILIRKKTSPQIGSIVYKNSWTMKFHCKIILYRRSEYECHYLIVHTNCFVFYLVSKYKRIRKHYITRVNLSMYIACVQFYSNNQNSMPFKCSNILQCRVSNTHSSIINQSINSHIESNETELYYDWSKICC